MTNLRDIFNYDPETGILSYKVDRGVVGKAGNAVGSPRGGYLITRIDKKAVTVHRIIWEWMTGKKVPDGMTVDHINRVKNDNRWDNLRLADRYLQNQNRIYPVGQSGLKGAYRMGNKWMSHIVYNGKRHFLGAAFATAEEAHAAYMAKRNELARGRI